jgi:MYXO-CTERM domain-containing protein
MPTAAEWGQFTGATLLVLAAAVAWRKRIGVSHS